MQRIKGVKLINFRTFFFLFIVVAISMFFAYKATTSLFYLFALLIPFSFFGILVFKRKFKTLVISIILIFSLCTYIFIFFNSYLDSSYDNKNVVISGNAFYQNVSNNDICYIGLKNVKIVDEDSNVFSLSGNLLAKIKITDDTIFYEGASLYFASQIYGLSAINGQGNPNSYYIKKDFKYATSVAVLSQEITQIKNSPSWDVSLKSYNKNLLVSSLGERNGNIAFSLLYGDRSDVPDDVITTFSSSGVMHIFAVSGLHVGIIVAILYFLLKKCGLRDVVVFFIEFIFLIIYSFLCTFSPSVLRASFMALCFLFSKIVGRKNDLLSTLSFAGIVLIVIKPTQLFDVGFQMSFASVFGIALFGNLILKFNIKNKIISYILGLICTSLATQIMLLPIFASSYGFVATWSILANLVTLPLFSIFYPMLFVLNIICLVFPFLSFVLKIPNLILHLIILLNSFVANLPFALVTLKSPSVAVVFMYYFVMFLLSRYTNKSIIFKPKKI